MQYRFSQPYGPYDANFDGDDGFVDQRSGMEREFPLVQVHDAESADLRMAMRIAGEVCNVSGAVVDLHHRTDNHGNANNVWDEDPDPTYWAPVPLKAFFAPGAIEVVMKAWGSDAPVKLSMYFAMSTLLEKVGRRTVRPGDVILVPFNAIGNVTPRNFRVINVTPIGNYRYAWLYVKCDCESLTGDVTVQPRQNDVGQIADYDDGRDLP